MEKKEKEQTRSWHDVFKRFFTIYFMIGVFLIFLCVIYNEGLKLFLVNYPFWQKLLNLFFSMISIIGSTLIIASVFTFSIESKKFIDYIKEQLENVIIKKEFLDKLNNVDKREALRRILSPDTTQYHLVSNIKNYFEEIITKAMTLFEYNFKSNLIININAVKINNKICLQETMYYRLYKGKNGFGPIKFGFVENETELISIKYTLSNGICKQLNKDDYLISPQVESGFTWNLYSYNIPTDVESEFVDTIINYIEYSKNDHWQLFDYKAITPSEGLHIIINCSEDLIIKAHMVYDDSKNYVCDILNNKKSMDLSTSQWISPGNGVYVLIAEE